MKYIHRGFGRTLAVVAILVALATAASAQSITTTFAGGNSFNGNMFDVKALTSITITSLDVNFVGTDNFEVWAITGAGTYLGNQSSNANWTLLGTAMNVVSLGSGIATPLPIPLNLVIPAGTIQGIYVTLTTGTMNYTNGSVQGALYTSNNDIEIYEGHGGGYPFALTNVPRVWNGTIYYSPLATVADDLGVTAVTAPVGQSLTCTTLSSNETVTMELRNWGMNPVPAGTTLFYSYQIDQGVPVIEAEILANPLTPGQLHSYTFVAGADFSAPGPRNFSVNVSYGADLDPSNDTLNMVVNSGAAQITTFPFTESFDSLMLPGTTPPLGWGQDPTDGSGNFSDWEFLSTSTPTPNTGPAADNSGTGGYAYVDDNGEFSGIALRTPCFDLGALIFPRLSFFLYSNNNNANPALNNATLSIDVISLTSGLTTTNALGPIGHIGSGWTYQFLDLSPWFSEVVQLVFRVNSANGSSSHDIAIDDLAVYEPTPTPGQSPQPGLAVLDINNARNGNQEPTYVPGNGPYFSSANVGGTLAFEFEGEPGRPIVLIVGPLNPVAATFPNVGQFDIGGPVDPLTGVPTSLFILADGGNAQGLNAFFVTGPAGKTELGFGVPNLPLGVLGSFQAVLFTSGANGAPVALSNAVEITLN